MSVIVGGHLLEDRTQTGRACRIQNAGFACFGRLESFRIAGLLLPHLQQLAAVIVADVLRYQAEMIEGRITEWTRMLAVLHGKRQEVIISVIAARVRFAQEMRDDVVAMVGLQMIFERELKQEGGGAERTEEIARVFEGAGNNVASSNAEIELVRHRFSVEEVMCAGEC